jgi:hypothetical protein
MIHPNIFKPKGNSNIFHPRNDWQLISLKAKKFEISLNEIIDYICKRERISKERFTSKSRKREIVEARQLYFKRAREVTRNSLYTIGITVGKDHATVLHGIKTIDNVRELTEKYNIYFKSGYTRKAVEVKPEPIIEQIPEPEIIKVTPVVKKIDTTFYEKSKGFIPKFSSIESVSNRPVMNFANLIR